jgi:hypothetical protein
MSHEISLPSGATATIKDPDDLTYGDREDFIASMRIDLDGKAQGVTGGRLMADLERGLVTVGVEAWTATDRKTGAVLPIPAVSPKSLRLLAVKDFARIATEVRSLQQHLMPEDFGPTAKIVDGQLVDDTESPTTPSVA